MFSADIGQLAVSVLAMVAVAGLAWVFLYPFLSGEAAAEKRFNRLAGGATPAKRGASREMDLRKKSVEDSIKELEKRQSNIETNPPLDMRMEQAGLRWSMSVYYMISGACACVAFVCVYFFIQSLFSAAAAAVIAGLALPRWYVNHTRNKRFNKFINEFPNALDVITRGVKAGLPVTDCLRICSQESSEPVRSEFRQVMEAQALNIPLGTAIEMLYLRVPLPETNFFSIVITVQQKSGGNLSEILGGLSKVLRDRKKMRGKIKAMSQEAIASASISGSLPLAVMGLLYFMNPDYISMLWQKQLGQYMLFGAFAWMTVGGLVMRKMINLDI